MAQSETLGKSHYLASGRTGLRRCLIDDSIVARRTSWLRRWGASEMLRYEFLNYINPDDIGLMALRHASCTCGASRRPRRQRQHILLAAVIRHLDYRLEKSC